MRLNSLGTNIRDSGSTGASRAGRADARPKTSAMRAGLDGTCVIRDVRQIMEEVTGQLSTLEDAEVAVDAGGAGALKRGLPRAHTARRERKLQHAEDSGL